MKIKNVNVGSIALDIALVAATVGLDCLAGKDAVNSFKNKQKKTGFLKLGQCLTTTSAATLAVINNHR